IRQLPHHCLVNQVLSRLLPEDALVQIEVADPLAGAVVERRGSHYGFASRILTRPPLGPGIAPRISSTFRAGSTRITRRRRTVTRSCPMWPGRPTPLKIRAASVAPADCGFRWIIEPCVMSAPCQW